MATGVSVARIAAVRAASGNRLSDEEIEQIVAAIDHRRRALEAEGKIDNLDERMREVAAEEANKVRLAATLQRKQAAMTILARDRTDGQLKALTAQGLAPKEAVQALFEGTVKGIAEGRHSIYAIKLAFEARYIGDMMAEVLQQMPSALRLVGDQAFAADIVWEMFEFRQDGMPGRSGNPDAAKVARVFAEYADVSRIDLNRLGANIGKLDDWGGPHAHDASKLLGVTDDAWISRIAPRLDLARTFPDLSAEEAHDALRDIYLAIVTGRSKTSTAPRAGDRVGPRDLVKSLGKGRFLRFKSADDWLAYQAEFGHGNIWTGMLAHQRKMAAIAAQTQILGPDPEAVLGSILDAVAREAIAEAEGVTASANPDGLTVARLFRGDRALRSMARFGDAIISAVEDAVTRAANLSYQGRSLLASYHDQMVGMIEAAARQTGADEKEIAYLIGEGIQGILGDIHASTYAEDSLPGAISSAMTTYFKWSGLTGRTDNIRATGARMIAAQIGNMSDRHWNALPDHLRFVLGNHGIDEVRWSVVRAAAFDGPNGNRYVTPDRISALPDELFRSFTGGDETGGKIARAKYEIELALRRFYTNEIDFGMVGATQAAGTLTGELLRLLFQLTPLNVAFTRRVFGRTIFRQRDAGSAVLHIGHLLAGSLVAGYLAMTAQDYMRGYDRRKFINPDGSANTQTLMTAFSQSGGAGIYGDYLFGQVDRLAGRPLEAEAGPDIGRAATLIENFIRARDGNARSADWLNFALHYTPSVNLAYVRPAVDFLLLNALKDSVAPGFLERQRIDRGRDYRQSLLYPQTIGGPQ